MVSTDSPIKWTPWKSEKDPVKRKILTKLGEEAGELVAASMRCLAQGIEECEPETGKPNREWLEDELADVWAGMLLSISGFQLDLARIQKRANDKVAYLKQWHEADDGS